MDDRVKRYEDDLKQLRKNRGLCLARADQIGPALREACGADSQDTQAEVVRKVTEVLSRHAESLAEEPRLAALTALGLDGSQLRFLAAREASLADRLQRNPRTARRRIDEACSELASLLAGTRRPAPSSAGTWHTEQLRVLLALDQLQPEALVFRHVIADADVLDELDLAMTLTAHDGLRTGNAVSIDMFAGGTLVQCGQETSERLSFALRPPKPLRRGEKHEIVMRIRVADMLPHYVCVPKNACQEFDLTVRFGERMPRSIGQLEKVFQNDVQDAAVAGTPVAPNGAGEVRVRFRNLEPGFAYGIRWST